MKIALNGLGVMRHSKGRKLVAANRDVSIRKIKAAVKTVGQGRWHRQRYEAGIVQMMNAATGAGEGEKDHAAPFEIVERLSGAR